MKAATERGSTLLKVANTDCFYENARADNDHENVLTCAERCNIRLSDYLFAYMLLHIYPSVALYIMKGQQAIGQVTPAQMREHYPHQS